MILDKLENQSLYRNITPRLAKAFDYLIQTDLNLLSVGTHYIEDRDIFALVQEYDTKDAKDCKLESHYKYIDIQYMVRGDEGMGVTTLTTQVPTEKNIENDYIFYEADSTLIIVKEGMFTVFFPNDIHKPCIKINKTAHVKKVVIKVRI